MYKFAVALAITGIVIAGGATANAQCTSAADCNDNDPCTTDSCIGAFCSFTPLNCNDDDPCTIDFCSDGVCHNDIKNCDDNSLLLDITIPHGAGWKAKGPAAQPKEYLYIDRLGAADGVVKAVLDAASAGKSKAYLKARGANLLAFALPLSPGALPVTVQLLNSSSPRCWTTDYSAPPKHNSGKKLVVKVP